MFEAVINPAGAGGRTKSAWTETKQYLEQYHIQYREHLSTPEYGITDIIRDLTKDGRECDLLIVGGDGTMNEAINGIADFSKVRLAYIPSGSANDLAKALGISSDVKKVVESLAENQIRRRIDIGRTTLLNRAAEDGTLVEDHTVRLFNISSGGGFDAAICEEVQRSAAKGVLNKIHLGQLSYIFVAVHQIFTTKRTHAKITLDHTDVREYDELLFTVGMNTAYEGGGFKFGPDADPNDGLLDLCVADHLSQWDFYRIFPYAYSGKHTSFDGVSMIKASHIEVETDMPVWIHTDGEIPGKSSHFILEIPDEKLNLMV